MKGLGNINNLLSQAKQAQEKMVKIQEELKHKTIDASSGGGMVKVTVNGEGQLLSLTINPEVVDAKDVDMLQDLIAAAVNEGVRLSREMASHEMSKVTGGISLPPGMSKMFGGG